MQVDPIKPKLKLPGIKRSKLKFEGPVSNLAFKFKLRRYNEASAAAPVAALVPALTKPGGGRWGLTLVHFSDQPEPFSSLCL